MKAWVKNYYLDGGTKQVTTDDNQIFYIDYRMNSPTTGKVFDHYPGDTDAKQIDIELEIIEMSNEHTN